MSSDDTRQAQIDPFREMNRYDDRDEDWRSDVVYATPRRTLHNGWQKFHAARDCGARKVAYVENNSWRMHTSDKSEFDLRCWECGGRIEEDEVLFVGGDWYDDHGWMTYGRGVEDLFIPRERVLELGPDPDHDELLDALTLGGIERRVGPFAGGPFRPEQWGACEECGHDVPLLFDDRCRMCYDGPWSERLQESLNAFEEKVRVWHNNSHVHKLEQKVDPLSIKGRCFVDKILWRRHANEPAPKLVEVTQCLQDDHDGHWEYVLTDMTHTTQDRYHEEDLADCFWDTGLYNAEHTKPVEDDRIREVYQRVCDHSFHTVHEDGAPAGEQCIHCLKRWEA